MADRFASDGIQRLDAFERGLDFDAAYFRETRPAYEGVNDEDCQIAWLHETEGAGSEREHLERLGLKLPAFPAAFPWQLYVQRRPAAGASRWNALADFVAHGFAAEDDLPFGAGAFAFLAALARGYAGQRDRLAIKAFELAERYGTLGPDERQHLADSYLREGFHGPARAIYAAILREGQANAWTIRNLVQSSVALQDWRGALDAVAKTRKVFGEDPVWRRTADEAADGYFGAQVLRARACYAEGRRADGDEIVAAGVAATLSFLEIVQPAATARPRGNRVVLCANTDDLLSRHHRIAAKGLMFDELGIGWTVVPMHEAASFEAALEDAGLAIFFQTPATPSLLRALLAARRHGVPTVYEAAAPIFDPHCMPLPYRRHRGLLSPALHDELTLAVELYRAFAGLCEYGLAPTDDIAARLAPLVRRAEAFTLADAVDRRGDPPRDEATPSQDLFVGSARFLFLDPEKGGLAGALLELLEADGKVSLTIAGPVHLAEAFDGANDRITGSGGPCGGVDAHLPALAAARACLVPDDYEGDTGFAGLCWLEAAQASVPCVIAAAAARALDLVDGRDCLVADGEWLGPARRLIDEPALAARIGAAARAKARDERNLVRCAAAFRDILEKIAAAAREGAPR